MLTYFVLLFIFFTGFCADEKEVFAGQIQRALRCISQPAAFPDFMIYLLGKGFYNIPEIQGPFRGKECSLDTQGAREFRRCVGYIHEGTFNQRKSKLATIVHLLKK